MNHHQERSQVRPWEEIHNELMKSNEEYCSAWIASKANINNMLVIHEEFMDSTRFYDMYEGQAEARKRLIIKQVTDWRIDSGCSIATIAERMRIAPSSVHRIEKNPLVASLNTIARYAHACGVKIRLEVI